MKNIASYLLGLMLCAGIIYGLLYMSVGVYDWDWRCLIANCRLSK